MIATTGFFDGVHLGHRLVIERLVSLAHERGDESLVVTFWPHPRAVLQDGARELRLLNSLEEKKELLRSLGVDRVEVLDFTRSFAALDRLTADTLKPIDEGIGMELKELLPLSFRPSEASGEISSTQIRTALENGDIVSGAEMLGYRYSLKGVVVAGNRLGRTIGFPTANMKLYEPLKLVPGRGVYAVEAEVLGKKYRGMTNIGLRPTVGGSFTTIETHILDFDEDIYGLPLRITFLRRLRDEVHFPSLEALKDQLEKDRECCREQK